MLTNTQVLSLCKAFPNGSLITVKVSKIKLHKIWQSGVFFGGLLDHFYKMICL